MDPEENETAALARLLPDLSGRKVLEVGCGDGRLTCRYADRADAVVAIDPDAEAIATFRDTIPSRLRSKVEMRVGTSSRSTRPNAVSTRSCSRGPCDESSSRAWSMPLTALADACGLPGI